MSCKLLELSFSVVARKLCDMVASIYRNIHRSIFLKACHAAQKKTHVFNESPVRGYVAGPIFTVFPTTGSEFHRSEIVRLNPLSQTKRPSFKKLNYCLAVGFVIRLSIIKCPLHVFGFIRGNRQVFVCHVAAFQLFIT